MKTELKDCPFCGGDAVMQTWSTKFAVVCRAIPYCAEGRPANSYEEAAKIWNTRALADAQPSAGGKGG